MKFLKSWNHKRKGFLEGYFYLKVKEKPMQGYAYIIEVLVFWRYNPIS